MKGIPRTASNWRVMPSGHRRLSKVLILKILLRQPQRNRRTSTVLVNAQRCCIAEAIMAQWKAIEMFKLRQLDTFSSFAIAGTTDNTERHSSDGTDRISGRREDHSCSHRSRDCRFSVVQLSHLYRPMIVVCCYAEFFAGLVTESIRRSVVFPKQAEPVSISDSVEHDHECLYRFSCCISATRCVLDDSSNPPSSPTATPLHRRDICFHSWHRGTPLPSQ